MGDTAAIRNNMPILGKKSEQVNSILSIMPSGGLLQFSKEMVAISLLFLFDRDLAVFSIVKSSENIADSKRLNQLT